MSYIFRGRLCGYICDDCPEPLSNVKVRLYRTRKEQNATVLAAARAKDTFAILNDKDVKEKESSLIGEFDTNEAGEFVAELDSKYAGEAFEVDVYCGTVPHRRPTPKPPKPLQFSITVVQPNWQPHGRDSIAIWDYCLSQRYWCLVRSRFHAWVICGRVTVCDTRRPAPQLKVLAFDVDWLQDDPLGSAITDADGRFRMDYLPSDFKKDVLGLNIELFGGPDLYFRIETLSGTAVLTEPPARGRDADRENVSNCFCVRLCVDELPEVTHAWFTRVGDFALYSDINYLGDGRTTHAVPFGFPTAHGGPGYGFFGHMKLVGDCPKSYPGGSAPMRYRFRYEAIGDGTGLHPMTSANIVSVPVGSRPITWDVYGTGPIVTSQPVYIGPGGATTPPGPTPPPAVLPPPGTPWGPIPPITLGPDASGWVTMDPTATNGGFSGPLMLFASTSVVPGGTAPNSGAGVAVTPAAQKNGTMLRIVFEAEPTSGATSTTPTLTNQLDNVYINNWSDVNELNLEQFVTSGNACTGLTNNLDILYTADHELMAAWNVDISSAAPIPPIAPPLPSGTTPRGEFGTRNLNITTWQPCSYRVTLTTRRKLTDGEDDDTGHTNLLTFCKK